MNVFPEYENQFMMRSEKKNIQRKCFSMETSLKLMLGSVSFDGVGVDEILYDNMTLQSKIFTETKELQKAITEAKEHRYRCLYTKNCPPITLSQGLRSMRMFHWMLQNGYLTEDCDQYEKLLKLLLSLLQLAQLKNESLKHLQSKKIFLATRLLQLESTMKSLSMPEDGKEQVKEIV